MTKKILVTIVIILVFAVAGVFFFMLFSFNGGNEVVLDNSGNSKGFIFGNNSGGEGGKNGTMVRKLNGETKPLLRLRKISQEPTSGFVSFENDNGETMVRYVERATGHVYEASTVSPIIKRISNTTIPRIYDVIWLNKNSFIMRYLGDDRETIKSFYAKIVKNKEDLKEGKIEGVFLVDNLKEIIPYGDKILSILVSHGGSQFVVSKVNGEDKYELFSSPLKEWLIQRPKSGLVILTTKPSFRSLGYMFFLNTRTSSIRKVLGGINGLTTLSGSRAKEVLLAKGLNLFSYDVENKKLENLGIKGLPEKCVWLSDLKNVICGIPTNAPTAEYPDDWYQGIVSFSDNIYKINLDKKTKELLVSPEDFSGESIDVIKPALGPNGKYLFFVNKKDLSLWSLDLSEKS